MALSTQPYKGARDFYPEDKRLQKYMFDVIRRTVESFGYVEYDAPILEPTELYASKTSEEIVNEQTYTFEDRGGRSVTIRTEMTPSVSRMVAAKRQELAYPLRWYSLPNLWRYERPQRGRLREFWQPNVDLFGVAGLMGDLEIIQVADAILQAFGAKREMYEFRINSRELLQKKIESAGVKTSVQAVTRVVDTLEKVEKQAFLEKLTEQVEKPDELYAFLSGSEADDEVRDLIDQAKHLGITNVRFAPAVARGFDYYTDIVFEVFDVDPDNNRSMFGGGRYDGLVGMFGVEPVPTVGFAMGDVTLQNFLTSHGLLPRLTTETDLAVLLVGDVYLAARNILARWRSQGLNVSVDTSGRKLDKQLKAAEKAGLEWVIVLGEEEIKTGTFPLKNLKTSETLHLEVDDIVEQIH